jgi:hypothetical protein
MIDDIAMRGALVTDGRNVFDKHAEAFGDNLPLAMEACARPASRCTWQERAAFFALRARAELPPRELGIAGVDGHRYSECGFLGRETRCVSGSFDRWVRCSPDLSAATFLPWPGSGARVRSRACERRTPWLRACIRRGPGRGLCLRAPRRSDAGLHGRGPDAGPAPLRDAGRGRGVGSPNIAFSLFVSWPYAGAARAARDHLRALPDADHSAGLALWC